MFVTISNDKNTLTLKLSFQNQKLIKAYLNSIKASMKHGRILNILKTQLDDFTHLKHFDQLGDFIDYLQRLPTETSTETKTKNSSKF
jgi:hypothetical protein